MIRPFLICAWCLGAFAPLARPAAASDRDRAVIAADRLPNIVLILADDLGQGDCRTYNAASKIPTPNIDRLAREGMRFHDAHSPSAVCTPTRYSIMTGQYAWRTRLKRGVLNGYSRSLLSDETTVAALLAEHGYATACIGKWHLGLNEYHPRQLLPGVDFTQPLERGPHTDGFEYSYIIPASLDMPPYLYVENGNVVTPATARTEGSTSRRSGGGGFWRAGPIAPDFEFDEVVPTLAARACTWLDERGGEDQPFFLYLPMPAPHTPWVPAAEFVGASQAGTYGDFVAQLDAVVGEIIESLERRGELDDTLIIFTSDNGAHWTARDIEKYDHRANGPWRGQKADIHEGGHRVPFVVRWPGVVAPGTVSNALVGLQDIMATAADVIGQGQALPSSATDSVSFLPALRGEPTRRTTLIHHSFDGMFSVRSGSWKFIEGLGSGGFTAPKRVAGSAGQGQCFNLASDPAESTNLVESQPDRVAELRALLDVIRNGPDTRGDTAAQGEDDS